MDKTVSTIIDESKCIGCGLCVKVCPSRTISLKEDKAIISGDRSIACDHCAAICPKEAVKVKAIDENAFTFKTFEQDERWLAHGEFDTVQLVRLMRSRRSCRSFTDKPVSREILEDLVKIGITAPSGTNSQLWTFTILPARESVLALGEKVAGFFKRLNWMAEQYIIRQFLKLVGKNELDNYYKEYYESIKEGIIEFEQKGIDRLFHGAPSAIIIGSSPGATSPLEDALLASQNILLSAHSMGLGTCLIGFAVEAIKNDISIKRFVKIPDNEKVYSVIAIGYPNEKYQRLTGRKKITPRYFENNKIKELS